MEVACRGNNHHAEYCRIGADAQCKCAGSDPKTTGDCASLKAIEMSKRLDSEKERIIAQYAKDIRNLPHEAAKVARFQLLIGELFGGTFVASQLSAGVEKAIRLQRIAGETTGFIDAYYGNAVIEFEKSLKATGKEAERQLQEYCAGVWAKEGLPYRQLLAVASDGLNWKVYRPKLSPFLAGSPRFHDVRLDEPIRSFTVTNETLADFYFWLNGLLFRTGQIAPTATQFEQDFGRESLAYLDALDALRKAWRAARMESEPALAFQNWQRYLSVTYGSLASAGTKKKDEAEVSELEELFLKHTYLASVARLMIWASVSAGKSRKGQAEIAREVLSGHFFSAQNLANIVEDDFFQWVRVDYADAVLSPVWEKIVAQIQTYDLSLLDQDVLKGVYQELVDPKDRHDLGEYYTPDWLCERVINELLPATGYVSVLDPTCGSGGFLRAAIDHLRHANQSNEPRDQLKAILDHVIGIDVHPLAVTIAKATYVLALGDLVKSATRPLQIPVYLADSLFLPTEVKQMKLGEGGKFKMSFGNKTVLVPDALIQSAEMFDPAITFSSEIALDHSKSLKETSKRLESRLVQHVPGLAEHAERPEIVASLWAYAEALAELIRSRRNSIWAFIIRNSYRPAMLRQHFDVIVGNPPWLSYRYISDPDYQAEVKRRAIEEYRIAPREMKLFTQMELATVFFAHSMYWFAKDGARIGFVMPRSVLSADQHNTIRVRNYSWRASFRLTEYWDLLNVRPLFNVPACVLFAERSDNFGKSEDPIPALEWSGTLKNRDSGWGAAKNHLEHQSKVARVIYLGDRSAISTQPGSLRPTRPSEYGAFFRQGATILPRSFYFVRLKDQGAKISPDGSYWTETDPVQAEESKKPYNDIALSGQIEGRYFFHSALSRHLLPFVLLSPATIVLPVQLIENRPKLLTIDQLEDRGDRDFAKWMKQVNSIWLKKREKKATRQSSD
jgi:type I restriction-modification system DNA methylase subunit